MHEIYEDPTRYYVITDLCQGGELFHTIANFAGAHRPFPEQDAVEIIEQLLSAVSYLHANEIIHMDLKPENILFLSKTGNRVTLVDFFLA